MTAAPSRLAQRLVETALAEAGVPTGQTLLVSRVAREVDRFVDAQPGARAWRDAVLLAQDRAHVEVCGQCRDANLRGGVSRRCETGQALVREAWGSPPETGTTAARALALLAEDDFEGSEYAAELRSAFSPLLRNVGGTRLEQVSAQVLLAGFTTLETREAREMRGVRGESKKLRKLRLVRASLLRLLGDEPRAVVHRVAVVAVWADVIGLAAASALRAPAAEQQAQMASAQAWAEGLRSIFFFYRLDDGGAA